MEKGLIDIRNKAKELSANDESAPYFISCTTLIAILDELELAQKLLNRQNDNMCLYPNCEDVGWNGGYCGAHEPSVYGNWPDRDELGIFDEPAP